MDVRENRNATIKDIAKTTGFSITTVSLVLNNKCSNIPELTQKTIREVAERLNYKPNYAARTLVTGNSNTIAIIIPDISNVFFAELVNKIQTELSQYGYEILLCSSEEKMANDIRYMNLMKQRKIDAMILSLSAESMENSKIIRKELENIDIPYIFLDRYFDGDYHKVIVDNTYGGEIVAKYLLEKGHINIGAIVGPLSLNSSRNRLEGFKKSLEKYGLSLNDNNIAYEQYNMASGYLGAEKLINNKVSAIFAFNDLQAYGVISYCKEHGIKIPEDISLVGFDDLPFSSIVDPKLTTVKQPLSELAHEACNMILSLIEKKDYDKEIKLKTQFVERESVRDMI